MPAAAVRLHSAGADAAPIVLSATLYLPEKDAGPGGGQFPGLVVGHGAGSRKERHAEFCREAAGQGSVVLALDFRGHGDSEGAADGPLEDDIAVAAGFLRKHCGVDRSRLCYRGSSMGGFYGLKAAATGTAGFAAVALLCPATAEVMLEGLDDIESRDTEADSADGDPAAPATRWDMPGIKDYYRRENSMALASRVKCPVLLVHARGDELVPFGHSLELAAHLPGDTTLVALAGGSHTSAQHDPEVHRLTARWLLDHTEGDPGHSGRRPGGVQIMDACTERT
jgi:dipeptidyl aminopeptidase/acylaminoacyl peptidase